MYYYYDDKVKLSGRFIHYEKKRSQKSAKDLKKLVSVKSSPATNPQADVLILGVVAGAPQKSSHHFMDY